MKVVVQLVLELYQLLQLNLLILEKNLIEVIGLMLVEVMAKRPPLRVFFSIKIFFKEVNIQFTISKYSLNNNLYY